MLSLHLCFFLLSQRKISVVKNIIGWNILMETVAYKGRGWVRCRKKTHREQHVFLVLVDSSGVWDGISVLYHTDGLTYKRHKFCMGQWSWKKADIKNAHFFSSVCLSRHLPVRMDWSTRRVVDLMEMILMSAGTLSPTSVHTNTHRNAENKSYKKLRLFISDICF